MKAKITKRVVDTTSVSERDQFIWDSETKGFGLKVTPKARRVYLVQTRLNGRLRRFTIGPHGSPWTPDQARREAIRILGLVATGADPSVGRSQAGHDFDVAQLADLYLDEGCKTKKPSTISHDRRVVKRHIKPLLGKKAVSELFRRDVERMMADVADGKTAGEEKTGFRGRSIVTGGEIAANNAVKLLSSMLSFAVNRGLINENPAKGVKKFRARSRERFLAEAELARLGAVLVEAEQEGLNAYAIAAIRLLLLTGCRRNEILTLRWDWIDFERGAFRLPDSKTGAKVVPLGRDAIEILQTIPRIDGNPYVLPSSKTDGHLVGLQKIWANLRERAGLGNVRLHDLRHTYASVGAASGESLYIVGKLVGHKQHATTQRYAHLADHPLQAAADRIASKISKSLQGDKESAMVVRSKQEGQNSFQRS